MAEIHNVFILKDGIPVFHVNPVIGLIQKDHPVQEKGRNLDSALVSGFLSAIASFASEIGIGCPITYVTEEMKFSFLSKNDLLFILATTNVQESEIKAILNEIAKKFIDMISRDNINVTIANLTSFNEVLKEILSSYVVKYDSIQESNLLEEYAQLVPHSHIVPETLERMSSTRRVLFKLMNGENSIYDIAKMTKQDPRTLLSVLRSYKKSGLISFQIQNPLKIRRIRL